VARYGNTEVRFGRMFQLGVAPGLMMDFKSRSLQGSQIPAGAAGSEASGSLNYAEIFNLRNCAAPSSGIGMPSLRNPSM